MAAWTSIYVCSGLGLFLISPPVLATILWIPPVALRQSALVADIELKPYRNYCMHTNREWNISFCVCEASQAFAMNLSLMRISPSSHPIVQGKVVFNPQSPPYNKTSTAAIVDIQTLVMAGRCPIHRNCEVLGMSAIWRGGAGKVGSASNAWHKGKRYRKRKKRRLNKAERIQFHSTVKWELMYS